MLFLCMERKKRKVFYCLCGFIVVCMCICLPVFIIVCYACFIAVIWCCILNCKHCIYFRVYFMFAFTLFN